MDTSNVRGLLMMPGGSNLLGMLPGHQGIQSGHSSADLRSMVTHDLTTKHDETDAVLPRSTNPRRGKARPAGSSVKSENKGDLEMLVLHTRVQELFAMHLSTLLNDPSACDLQCCVTYGKPCGCIRKYILAGVNWKDNSFPNLRINLIKDKDDSVIAANDRAAITQTQITRTRELLEILHHAAELKKEKCYVTSEGADGKPLKELRGMIGLGNGRKRSKKYEDYVLEKRGKLRQDYSLCEKAAQKLLGYSINFLYKKLRTNPQKTSRLVATNKAERASKVPRNLISLHQLQEMANSQQSASQCCCRNCISWLVKQHFDKIVKWRKRLEGSGQRVAQEIVAEVLLESASLDGQNSFCQNLVHWVTGCSFKKIRRVRDHLKKDPKSLPEHGLKKYWKDKVKNQGKGRNAYTKPITKTEKDPDLYIGAPPMERFPAQYDMRMNARSDNPLNREGASQLSNRYDNQSQYVPSTSPNPPPNQTVSNAGMAHMFPAVMQNSTAYTPENALTFRQLQRPSQPDQQPAPQMFPAQLQQAQTDPSMLSAPGISNVPSSFTNHGNLTQEFTNPVQSVSQGSNVFPQSQDPSYNTQSAQQNFNSKNVSTRNDLGTDTSVARPQRTSTVAPPQQQQDTVQYHEQRTIQQPNYPQPGQSKDDLSKFYSAPFIAGFADPNVNLDGGQPSYYFAANPTNPQQDGFFHTGLTPLCIAPAQQPDGNHTEQDGAFPSQFTGQSFFLLSPALPNATDKQGSLNAGNFENWKQMVMPITPIQMYPASYFQNGMQNEGDGKNNQQWGTDGQHVMFPVTDGNMAFNSNTEHQDVNYGEQQALAEGKRQHVVAQSNHQQGYFQPALTPVAVMPQGNNFFSNVGWLAAPPSLPPQAPVGSDPTKKADLTQYMNTNETNQVKYYTGEAAGDPQTSQYIAKDGQYVQADKSQLLPVMSQWASANMNQGFSENQPNTNQWVNPQGNAQEQKAQYPQQNQLSHQVSTLPLVTSTAATQSKVVPAKVITRGQMPPLAPIQGVSAEMSDGKTNEENRADNDNGATAVTTVDTDDTSYVKGAPIASRSQRFSRDRLRATIDSPLIPPVTPLTPALTPHLLAEVSGISVSENSKDGNLSASSSTSQTVDSNSVFRFPPAHHSRRMAALRMEGHITDASKDDKGKTTDHDTQDQGRSASKNDGGDAKTAPESNSLPGTQTKLSATSSEHSSKNLSASIESCGSLGYIPDAYLQSDASMLVDLNDKSHPVLRLPSTGWPDENVAVKTSEAESSSNQQLQTPTQVLNSPTHQLTPSVPQLHTPTHQLHTPNQALNTPTQPLNTPTQPLNTPTDLTSPSHSSILVPNEEESPVKVLMPAPAGKKRKADGPGSPDEDKPSNQKQIRFHSFTPKDFASGKVNVSAFRKPSEFASGNLPVVDSSIAKRRRKPRKQTNPQAHGHIIEIQDDDKSDASADEETADKVDLEMLQPEKKDMGSSSPSKSIQKSPANSDVSLVVNPMSSQTLKTPAVLQRVTPMFNIPPTSGEDASISSAAQHQLNTPVFLHSAALNSALMRRPSPNQSNASGRLSSSTPQFFTFMASPSFPAPMFFTPSDPDLKQKLTRPKSAEGGADSNSDKLKRNTQKRSHMTLNFSSKQLSDDALQTPSRIPVVTPSTTLASAGGTPDMPQIFCFQEVSSHNKPPLAPFKDKTKTPDSSVSSKEIKQSQTEQSKSQETKTTEQAPQLPKGKDDSRSAQGSVKLRPPSLVVDPPSDSEDEDGVVSKESKSPTQPSQKKEKDNRNDHQSSPVGSRPTLHRARSGGKADLVLSLTEATSPANNEDGERAAHSPLNTPSGIQVITPTMMSASKLTSPVQRYPPGMRVRPQSLMMAAPICLTPGGSANNQVATPTLLHIISPSQAVPSSPSVFVYPYPPRGFLKGPGAPPSGSLGSSPGFGILQRTPAPSGVNSASLLKSALMKKMPVFQFPPVPVRATTPEVSASPEKDAGSPAEEGLKPPEVRQRLNSAPDYSNDADTSSSSANEGRPSSTGNLADKLSGANDPCLSEAAQ